MDSISVNFLCAVASMFLNSVIVCFAGDYDESSETKVGEKDTILFVVALIFVALGIYSCLVIFCCYQESCFEERSGGNTARTRTKRIRSRRRHRHLQIQQPTGHGTHVV